MMAFVATWWFWITVIIVIDLIVCEATESPIIGAVSIVAAAVMYQFVADVNWFGYLMKNPLSILLFAGGYFVVGTIWRVCKWALYSLDKRTQYREIKNEFFKIHKLDPGKPVPMGLMDKWNSQFSAYVRRYRADYPPIASQHKKRIVTWISYWPFSMIWSLVSDFVERIAKAIYNFISTFLQRISDRIFANELVEFDEAKVPPPPESPPSMVSYSTQQE